MCHALFSLAPSSHEAAAGPRFSCKHQSDFKCPRRCGGVEKSTETAATKTTTTTTERKTGISTENGQNVCRGVDSSARAVAQLLSLGPSP
ncbi:unnamed protein product, partial [Polarella glacialis]